MGGGAVKFVTRLRGGDSHEVELSCPLVPGETCPVRVDGVAVKVVILNETSDRLTLEVDGRRFTLWRLPGPGDSFASDSKRELELNVGNRVYRIAVESELDALRSTVRPPGVQAGSHTITSRLPGIVGRVLVREGDVIEAGDPVLTLEAMKMENELRAELGGVVTAVHVTPGKTVPSRAPLVTISSP